jgi:hypothetical protein
MPTYSRELTAAELAAMIAGTTFPVIPVNNRQRVGLLVVFGEACTAGAVALKSAATPDFAGAWAEQPISAECPGSAPGANGSVVTGAGEVVGAFIRPELTVALAGGTITKLVIYVS